MATYSTWEEVIKECEDNMKSLEENKAYCFSVYEQMHRLMDSCLQNNDYDSLLEILPYFEEPDKYPRLHHSSETRRIHVILNALKMELKYEKLPFLSSVHSHDDFMKQYTMTVFALRRLELMLSPSDMEEAVSYLTSIPFNIYSARFISENEYFENYENLYWNLYSCMKSIWSPGDKIQWLVCLLDKEPSSRTLLELSSLYFEIEDYAAAYRYLTQIPEPSSETLALISSIKELFHYE